MHHQPFNHATSSSLPEAETAPVWAQRLRSVRAELDYLEVEVGHASRREGAIEVRDIIRARALRRKVFNPDMFADPAWDILLELYACQLDYRRISVSKLSFAVHVPATTVLRWIGILEREGFLTKTNDPLDGRRVWVELSETGTAKMKQYFELIG